MRTRWLVHALSKELFGTSILLPAFPQEKSVVGLGLTDSHAIASLLEDRLSYKNTFLHQDPRFDITRDPSPIGPLDFLIASDVFEHVEPPVNRAFRQAAAILKPSGFLLLTVPWVFDGAPHDEIPELTDWKLISQQGAWAVLNRRSNGETEVFAPMSVDGGAGPCFGRTREHFPNLHDWSLTEDVGETVLHNNLPSGQTEVFRNLVFHGGAGLALEMRLFTRDSLEQELRQAGFLDIRFESQEMPQWGIFFPYPWSRPLVARIRDCDTV
ncbi:MAG: methyltransferase domain-containing protein [Bryobacteraceae bacterium]